MSSSAARGEGQPDRNRPARTWTGAGRINTGDDVDRVLAAVTAVGRRRDRTAGLVRVVDRAENIALSEPDGARVLPVAAELVELLPWPRGIRRGATVAAIGSMSLIPALLADAMAQGAWAAIVGAPTFSPIVSIEYGIDLSRLALVPRPSDDWPDTVAALVDGLDMVVVATPAEVPASTARSLMARARRRGCVLVPTNPWPGCDVTLRVLERRWHGLGQGRGRLRLHEVTLTAVGRGRAERPRQVNTTLPPPSIAERVGPLPGQIPGLPITVPRDPDRLAPARAGGVPRPVPSPEPEPWWEKYRVG